jgi:murein DD-endopeptidase MepM/ murein hydrolase activator NlpD
VTLKRCPDNFILFLGSVILIAFSAFVFAESETYPRILKLAPSDVLFKQLQDSIAQGYKAHKAGDRYPDLFVCVWQAVEGDDVFSLAARLSLPYETLATMNGLARPRAFKPGERILVPSVAGLFIPEVPRNDFDRILASSLDERTKASESLVVNVSGRDILFAFYPGERLYQTERSFFLEIGFRMPLPEGVLTSSYGWRRSPIDGHDRMHEGVDLAAPEGTPVLAAREGQVIAIGTESALGLRVIVEHEGGMKTIYGHLRSTSVVLNQTLRSGTMIGEVGSTGLSTGPHLHFEIRLSGKTRDPSAYLPGLKP